MPGMVDPRASGEPVLADDPPDRRDEELLTIVPDNPNKPYDMKEIIVRVVDDGDFMEVHRDFAPNIVVGFARLDGMPVGPFSTCGYDSIAGHNQENMHTQE
mgnify:CR=1 FL=1